MSQTTRATLEHLMADVPNGDPEPEEAPLTAFGNYDQIKDGIKVS